MEFPTKLEMVINLATAKALGVSVPQILLLSTSVPKPDGSGRAIGTILDPQGKAIADFSQGKPFYGEVPILGTPTSLVTSQ